ncbi:MAG: hypothetical protein K6F83_00670 [Clostridiales bacterium]|nr:hypothetical protein [Clostridiales bacterium]
MQLVAFKDEEKYVKEFISLPQTLYTSKDNMEEPDTMRKILLGEHPLSSYFKLDSFLVTDDGVTKGRFCITSYEGDDTAYFGFFECVNDKDASKFLFDSAYDFCAKKGFKKMEGPVDASFWIKYRLKINRFEEPYTGEPYNKDYYYDMFLENGFTVKDHYASNEFRAVDESYENELFESRFEAFIKSGYEIRSPKEEEFGEAIDDVYRLVTDLYSDFPVFKDVKKEDFRDVFMSYKQIMNMSMTKLAYFNGKAVGFYISIPDYGNLVYHTSNPINIVKILKTKKKPKRYVMLYMGVDQEHRGLGKALTYSIMKELKRSGLPSIGALIRDGKVNQKYASEDITGVYEYVLMEKEIG